MSRHIITLLGIVLCSNCFSQDIPIYPMNGKFTVKDSIFQLYLFSESKEAQVRDVSFNNCVFSNWVDFRVKERRHSIWLSACRFRQGFSIGSGYRFINLVRDTFLLGLDVRFNLVLTDAYKYIPRKDTVDLSISFSKLPSIHFVNANIVDFFCYNCAGLKRIDIYNSNFLGSFNINPASELDSLILEATDFSGIDGDVNLNVSCDSKKEIGLRISRTNCEKLNLDYSRFHLAFHNSTKTEEKLSTYQYLLQCFNKRGMTESYQKLDKEYQEFKYTMDGTKSGAFANWIDKNWWDYGYNKVLIFRNAIIFNLIFFIINLLFYREILINTYKLDAFKKLSDQQEKEHRGYPIKYFFKRVPYVFLYTGFIFWGLKLDMQKIKIRRIGWFFHILIQYIVGVICLAYIANFIITR